ncbi:hypothetical protein QFC22_000286 [Naganishia vaughanmartiniae]|uniref:Uncharacterized protein n=1 Tax=Naganishia vaughanmartiniae TaxID=1424756 RepID=A0ACC2XPE5_9TREE|nr:hypothetical protein QFC22_000286 [Naganishia vaughanmartiniae]
MGKGSYAPSNVPEEEDGHPGAGSHYVVGRAHPSVAKAVQLVHDREFAALLVRVQGWIKTPDHFYLIEDLSSEHVPLSDLSTPLSNIGFVRKILDQLVSVVRDGLHRDGRVCHRDLKAENILINDHGDLVLLDLGLATRFAASAPKLTTCCGSPAFHSPEIVQCLNNPPGVYRYYGPELDIWCIGLTMLALLTGRRYPIGTSHTHLEVMAHNVKECLQEVDHIHERLRGLPCSSAGNEIDIMQAQDDWDIVRDAVEEFLLVDGNARILAFERYQLDECIQKHVACHKAKMEKLRCESPQQV